MVLSTLEDISMSIELILKRFKSITSADDFLASEAGLEKLDAISMRLIAIGEGFKNIDKLTDRKLLPQVQGIDWRGVKGIRDVLSHHYFDLDAETIYEICATKMETLLKITEEVIEDYRH